MRCNHYFIQYYHSSAIVSPLGPSILTPFFLSNKYTVLTVGRGTSAKMSAVESEVYMILMEFDEQYERLKAHSQKGSTAELEKYVSNKHDMLLQKTLEAGSYQKRFSWVIIDGFVAEMTSHQAEIVRSAKGVRAVEKDRELKPP